MGLLTAVKPPALRERYDLTIAVVILILIIFLSIAYIIAPISFIFTSYTITKEVIVFFTALVGGGSAIYSAYYTGIGLHQRVKQEKIKNSYEFMRLIYDNNLIKFRLKIHNDFHPESMAPNEFYDKLNEDLDMATTVRSSLNLCEDLSIAIQEGFADEVVAHRSLVFIVVNTYETFLPYIKHIRNKHNDTNVYCELEKLASSWKQGKYINTNENLKVEFKG